MTHRLRGLAVLALAGVSLCCSTGTDEPSFDNPFDPVNGADLPTPDSLSVFVGNTLVRLEWSLPPDSQADNYAVFRRRLDGEDGEDRELKLVGRVTSRFYQDSLVRNGRVYGYRIAAGVDGRFGQRTEELEARPDLFAIVIENDVRATNKKSPTVTVNVPPTATAVAVSEDPDNRTAPWRPLTLSLSWTFSPGEGSKSLYARFRLFDGSESLPVFDSILLDTRAIIQSVEFDGNAIRTPGDRIHFRLDAGEANGEASIEVPGVFSEVALFDDGSEGDAAAGDGIYERSIEIPAGVAAAQALVVGHFRDEAGNEAAPASATRSLTIQYPPEPVSLLPALTSDPPDPPGVTLRWTESLEPDFASYRIFRALGTDVDSADRLIRTINSPSTLEHSDADVIEGETYSYRVYVRLTSGVETGSNPIQISVPNLRPPAPVTLQTPDAVGTQRIALQWTKSGDRDFARYRVLRNDQGAVSATDSVLVEIADIDQTFHDDAGLRENTEYFYRIYVFDEGGLSARSNELRVVTRNEAPPAVVLNDAGDVTGTAATLTWSESTAHDFARYQLYRDTRPTVTTASTLAVEIDEASAVSFRDRELNAGTRYYYRVFVTDHGENPSPLSTGSNTITFQTP